MFSNKSVLRLLITGAAGNLGTLLTRHLLNGPHQLTLLIHKKQIPDDIARNPKVRIQQADLGDSGSLQQVCRNIDCVVHLAGVLFRPHPEKYLHVTNTLFVQNLVDASLTARSLASFCLVFRMSWAKRIRVIGRRKNWIYPYLIFLK